MDEETVGHASGPDAVGRRIDHLRRLHGWTWKDVSQRTGIHAATLAGIARGHRRGLDLKTWQSYMLAKVFGVSLDWLVGRWTDDPESLGPPLPGESPLATEGRCATLLSLVLCQELDRELARSMDDSLMTKIRIAFYGAVREDEVRRAFLAPPADAGGDAPGLGGAGL